MEANQISVFTYAEGLHIFDYKKSQALGGNQQGQWRRLPQKAALTYKHEEENAFGEFDRETLIPHWFLRRTRFSGS